MKTILLVILWLMTMTAHAVEIKCPAKYSSEAVPFSAVPSGHKGSGIVRGASLSNAYIYVGKLHDDPTGDGLMLVPKVLKGGWLDEVTFTPDETKWIVCVYGGGGADGQAAPLDRTTGPIEWWEQIDPIIENCVLKVMKIKFPRSIHVEYTAIATCK
jgi:hypothetical protein